MTEKYLLFSLDDEKSKRLGEVISNPTCKRIVNLLAEKEMSENDISIELKIPLNTVDYNIKKLLEAGIIEKSKNFFWSVKGKRIETYKVANKLIVISPKKSNVYSKLKGIVPSVLVCGVLSAFVAWYYKTGRGISYAGNKIVDNLTNVIEHSKDVALPAAGEMSDYAASSNVLGLQNHLINSFWLWFAAGALIAIIAFLAWNWKKL